MSMGAVTLSGQNRFFNAAGASHIPPRKHAAEEVDDND